MKRLLSLLGTIMLVLCYALPAFSQILNPGFETWVNSSPANWFVINNVPGVGLPVSQSNVAHGGSSAARGEVLPFPAAPTVVMVPAMLSGSIGTGFSYTQRPGSFTGYYQFSPAAGSGDKFVINVVLTKGPYTTGVVVAAGGLTISNAATTYTQLNVPLTYQSATTPDTAYIQFVITSITAQPKAGSYYLIDDLAFSGTASTVEEGTVPRAFALEQNYPNPFNPSTKINFSVAQPGHVMLKVYNLLGTEVASLVNEQKGIGTFNVNWNAAGLPSGMYLYRLSVTSEKGILFDQAKKLMLLK